MLDAGADDCISYKEEFHEIHCAKDEIYKVKKTLEKDIDFLYQLALNGYQ